MKTRARGESGHGVTLLGFGCMGLRFGYGPPMEKLTAVGAIRAAVEQGVT